MGKVTRAVFDASTATVFADNTNEDISEGDFRTKFDDVSASAAFLEDVNTFSKQQRWKKGADVASATVLPLIEDGNYFDVTGTVTVTSFADLGGAGTVIILQFDAACILTHHVTNLILPTGGNITTAAGDHAIFVNYASGDYRCVNYQRKDGTALVGGDVTKVGTPVNNQVGVWTSDGNLEGDSKLTFDGTTLGVTGGATFSGILTLGSTLSNGTYTYTLPGATGTLALTSDVTTAVANLVDTAPSTLDTLNELAAALGDDPNFATTVTNSIATKQPQLNGTGFVKISGTTISYDNSTYLTTASASSTYLPLTGGTLTGALGGTSASFSGSVTITGSNALRGSYGSSGVASNFAAGDLALSSNTTGYHNTAIGWSALTSNTEGFANVAYGSLTLAANTTGAYNTAYGMSALGSNLEGESNTATGFGALFYNTGNFNTANGRFALFDNSTGGNNTALGYNTGKGITTGSGNTVLGANVTGLAAGLTNNIILANGTGAIKAQHDGTDWAFTGGATFSSSVDATVFNSTGTSGYLFRENSGSGYGIFKNSTSEIGIAVNGTVALNFLSTGAATFSETTTLNATGNSFTDGSLVLRNSDGTTNTYLTNAGGGFYLSNNGASSALSILSTGAATFSSTVSIGGADQGYQLDVKRTSTGDATFDTVANFYKASTHDTGLLLRLKNTIVDLAANNITGGGGPSAGMSFSVSSGGTISTALTITSGGNVGINQTPLVNAKLYIRGADSSTSMAFITDNTNGIGTFSIRNDGVIASGTATNAPYNYAITSTRDLLVDTNGNFGTAASIREAKINIENESNVNWLYDLNPVKFNYRQRDENRNYLDKAEEEQRHGLIAEEVEEVNTDFCWYNVNEEGDKELVGVDYKMLITPMLKAIQEQQTIIEDLKTIIEDLKTRIEQLEL
jgi:trimeric autotransporter adhesin